MKRPSGFDRAPEPPDGGEPWAAARERSAGDDGDDVFDDLASHDAGVSGRDAADGFDLTEEPADREDPGSSGRSGFASRIARAAGRALPSSLRRDAGTAAGASLRKPPEKDTADRPADDGSALGGVDVASAETVDLSSTRRSLLDVVRSREREADPVRAAERRLRAATRKRKATQRRERRRFSASSRRRRRNWWIALSAVGALALFVVVGTFTPLMAVRDIEVTGATTMDASKVEDALKGFDGRPLALVSDGDVHSALEPFPQIQRYAIELVPPHTLRVRVEERVAVISIEHDKKFRLYDAAGVLLGEAETPPEGVPLGTGKLTDLDGDAFAAAATALRNMPDDLRQQITGVTASTGHDVTLTMASGVSVFWGDAEQSASKAVVLKTMISSLGDRPVKQIDVSSVKAPVFN